MKRGVSGLAGVFVLLAASVGHGGDDDVKRACIVAHADTQRHRQKGELTSARDAAVRCAQSGCPDMVRGECLRWVPELDEIIPSVLIEAEDAAGAPAQAVITVDGVDVTTRLGGAGLPLEPGTHTFRADFGDGRHAEQRVVLREGQKRRRITLVMPSGAVTSVAPPVVVAPPVLRAPNPSSSRPTWPLWVTSGAAAAAVGGFAWFGVAGREKEATMRASCAPRCSSDDVRAMRRDYLAADLFLGAALIATGATVWLHLAGARIEAAPVRGGGSAAVGGRFLSRRRHGVGFRQLLRVSVTHVEPFFPTPACAPTFGVHSEPFAPAASKNATVPWPGDVAPAKVHAPVGPAPSRRCAKNGAKRR